MVDNPVFYRKTLTGAAYRSWLHSMGVKYVLLPGTRLDPVSAPAESKLLRSGRAGLIVAFRGTTGTIYELPRASRLLTGPGPARLTTLSHATIAGRITSPGRYLLRVHYNPHWALHATGVCLQATSGGMTELNVTIPGSFKLTDAPGIDVFLSSLLRNHTHVCDTTQKRPIDRPG